MENNKHYIIIFYTLLIIILVCLIQSLYNSIFLKEGYKNDSIFKKTRNVILMGDFNSLPNSEPIKIVMNKLEDGMMNSKNKFKGELSTFNGFEINKKNDGKRIDYIFSKNLNINSYNHLYDKRQNSLYVSDHFPVLISFYK